MPKEWKLDAAWDSESKESYEFSHLRDYPSKWSAASPFQDPVNTVRIVDHFVIPRQTNEPASEPHNGLVTS